MKIQAIDIQGKVRKSSVKFAQALTDSGVKVASVHKTISGDRMIVKGKRKFSLSVLFDYVNNCMVVDIFTRKGHLQTAAFCKTANEFRTLCRVWNVAEYAA
jgi:hypothetical protein